MAVEAPLDETAIADFTAAMDNDFGTPAAVAAIFETVRRANVAIDDGRHDEAASSSARCSTSQAHSGSRPRTGQSSDAEIDAPWTRGPPRGRPTTSPRRIGIRDELAGRGITLEDTAGGTIWHRST